MITCPPPVAKFFEPTMVVAVGFGSSGLYRDGELIVDGEERIDSEDEEELTGQECERIASADPNHVWEIVLNGPLQGATYTRTSDGRWPCTKETEGFA